MTQHRPGTSGSDAPEPGIWTARRGQLHDALRLRGDATVADLYRRAVDALGEEPLTSGALMIGSHCIRELVNRLPRVLGEVELERPRGDGSSETLLERALIAYEEDPTSETTAHLADAARGLIDSRRQATERAARMRAALVQGDSDPSGSRSTLAAVKRAVDWFEKYRHPQQRDLSRWPSTSTGPVIEHLETIEGALYGRLGRFFDVLSDVRDLLESANSKDDDEWVTPTPQMVRGVLPRLADPQHRRAFFLGLHNPRWMPILDAQHAFSDPPLRRDLDGSADYQGWPQGDYLRNVAAEVPVEACRILARVFHADVAWSVHELVVTLAGEVPREAAAILAKPVVSCVTSGYASRFIGVDAITVVESLASGSRTQRRKATLVANSLLEPFRDPDSPSRPLLGRFTVTTHVDHFDYEDALRRVVAAFAGDLGIFRDLVRWLALEQLLSGSFDPDGHDVSHIRRPSMDRHRRQMSFDSVGDPLIDVVRDCTADLASSVGLHPVLDTLRSQPARIFTRIELHFLANEIQRALQQHQQPSDEVLTEARRRLADPELAENRNCHRELEQLAAAALPLLDEVEYQQWEEGVLSEPDFDEATRTRIATFSPGSLTPDEALTDFVEQQRLHRLAAIGRESLRGRAREALDELEARHGLVPARDDSGGWVEEPRERLGFADMSPREVLDQMACPARRPGNDVAGSSPTGTSEGPADGSRDSVRHRDQRGSSFGHAVRLDPAGFSALSDEVVALHPNFLSYFLSGLTDALRLEDTDGSAGSDGTASASDLPSAATPDTRPNTTRDDGTGTVRHVVDWNRVLAALSGVDSPADLGSQQEPSSEPRLEPGFESREQRNSIRKDVCRLLEAGAARDIPTATLHSALALAAAMTSDPDPTRARDEEVHEHAVREPLSYSADAVRSSALNTVLVIAAAYVNRTQGPGGSKSEVDLIADPLMREVLAVLDRRLGPDRDPSIAIAAVFGEHAGWLLRHFPEWFGRNSAVLATVDAFGEAFITVALSSHYPNLGLLEAAEPGLMALLDLLARREPSQPPERLRRNQSLAQLFGDRILKLYLWGHLELDHPMLAEYHARTPISDRATVLSELGWEMVRADAVEPTIIERAMVLWDARKDCAEDSGGSGDLAELAGFESWVRCGFFPPDWWLPRLVSLARAVDIEGLRFVGEELAFAAEATEHLPAALAALDLLVRQSRERTRGIPYQLRTASHRILLRALRSRDTVILRQAGDLLDFMGRHGGNLIDHELAALADEVTYPSST